MVGSKEVGADPQQSEEVLIDVNSTKSCNENIAKSKVHISDLTEAQGTCSEGFKDSVTEENSSQQALEIILEDMPAKLEALHIDEDELKLKVEDEPISSSGNAEKNVPSDDRDPGQSLEVDGKINDHEDDKAKPPKNKENEKHADDPAAKNGLTARAPPGLVTATAYNTQNSLWHFNIPKNGSAADDDYKLPYKYMKARHPVENDETAGNQSQNQFLTVDPKDIFDPNKWIDVAQMSRVSESALYTGLYPEESQYIPPVQMANSPMSATSSPPYINDSFYHREYNLNPSPKPDIYCASEKSMQMGSPASSYSASSPGNDISPQTILPELNSNQSIQPNLAIFNGSGEILNAKVQSPMPCAVQTNASSPNHNIPSPTLPTFSPAHPHCAFDVPELYKENTSLSGLQYNNGSPPIPCAVQDATCSDEISMSTNATTVIPTTINDHPTDPPVFSQSDLELVDKFVREDWAKMLAEKRKLPHQEPLKQAAPSSVLPVYFPPAHHHVTGQRPLLPGPTPVSEPRPKTKNPRINCQTQTPQPILPNTHYHGQRGYNHVQGHTKPLKKPETSNKPEMSSPEANRRACLIATDRLMFKDHDGDSTLMIFVVKEVPFNLIKALLARYKRENMLHKIINEPNNLMQTPVYMATVLNLPRVVSLLIEHGADVNLQAHMNEQSARGPLHCAASKGDNYLCTMRALLESPNVNVNQTNFDGLTPLHCAIKAHGSLPPNRSGEIIFCKQIIEELVSDQKTDVERADGKSGKTPVHYVVESKQPNLVDHLFTLITKYRPYHRLAQYVNKPSFDGSTSLHIAVGLHIPNNLEEHKTLVSLLMRSGADPTIKNTAQKMPKELAKHPDILAIVKGTTGCAKR